MNRRSIRLKDYDYSQHGLYFKQYALMKKNVYLVKLNKVKCC